jgi:NAD(P) transhydrogenase
MARYDFIVLGAGPAGRRAAIQAAKLGKSVVVVDDRAKVGGVSVHTGTIPSKTLRETALNLSGWRERAFYGQGYRTRSTICSDDLDQRIGKTFDYEVAVLEHQFARNGVQTIAGRGYFKGPNQIAIKRNLGGSEIEEVIEGDKILISVGTRPYRPSHIPFNKTNVFDSDSFILQPQMPSSLTVVGGGVIGLEYATIFSALDIPVTLIEPNEQLLPFMDKEIVDHLVQSMRERGMVLRLGCSLSYVHFSENGDPICQLADGRLIGSKMVLFAAGREGSTSSLNLEACGIETDSRGRLDVDRTTFQTTVPNIYAAGDVIGFPSLASTSMEQGRAVACHAFGNAIAADDQKPPYGVYAVPELSSVGMSEADAREAGIPYECGIARFKETSRGHIMGLEAGILKLICHRDTRKLIGVHVVGEGASELVHIGQAVLNLGGTIDYFVENSFNYPTLAEGYKVAALDLWNRLQVSPVKQEAELEAPKKPRKSARKKAA